MKDNTQFPHNETEEEDQSFKDGIELLKIKHSTNESKSRSPTIDDILENIGYRF